MKLYGKNNLEKTLSGMERTGRVAHSWLMSGADGAGKKVSAKYTAMWLLCDEKQNGLPCGKCRNCSRVLRDIHPDVIYPEKTGKTQSYSADTVRSTIEDCFTAPNDGLRKIYIFPDCNNINQTAQNALLKIIEEPPDHVYFIFTAVNKSVFLPTILSRVTSISIGECSEEECSAALSADGDYTPEDISEAVSAYHGNIGRCRDYLEKGVYYSLCDTVRSISSAMIQNNEYEILKQLSALKNRDAMKQVLDMLDDVIRDALVFRVKGAEAELLSCCTESARALSARLTRSAIEGIHEFLVRARSWCSISANINMNAAACAVSARLCR